MNSGGKTDRPLPFPHHTHPHSQKHTLVESPSGLLPLHDYTLFSTSEKSFEGRTVKLNELDLQKCSGTAGKIKYTSLSDNFYPQNRPGLLWDVTASSWEFFSVYRTQSAGFTVPPASLLFLYSSYQGGCHS